MTNALTVSRSKSPVINFDPSKLDYDAYEAALEREGAVKGGIFAGTEIAFKQGVFVVGYGTDKEELASLRLVVNFPYATKTWRKFNGKYMEYGAAAMIAANETLPDREEMGDNDKSEWPLGKFGSTKGQPEDPWKECLVLMARTKKGELFYFTADTISKRIAFSGLLKDIILEARRKPGMLPLVEFTAGKAENKDGEKFDVMKTAIVGWEKATKDDDPSNLFGGGDDAAIQEEDDDAPKKLAGPKATPRKAKKSVVEDDEPEIDEDEEAEVDAEGEFDDEDEDEEEVKPTKKAAKAAPKAASRTGKKRAGRFD